MFGAILKATKSSFQKGMIFCRSIYVKKVMKLLAFIFEQPSYLLYLKKQQNLKLSSAAKFRWRFKGNHTLTFALYPVGLDSRILEFCLYLHCRHRFLCGDRQ